MVKLTIKKLKELLELGEGLILREVDDDGMQYILIADGDTFLGIKRKWDPEHPVEQNGWLDLALVSGIKPQDVVKRDLVQDLDDSHQEWVDELAGLDD